MMVDGNFWGSGLNPFVKLVSNFALGATPDHAFCYQFALPGTLAGAGFDTIIPVQQDSSARITAQLDQLPFELRPLGIIMKLIRFTFLLLRYGPQFLFVFSICRRKRRKIHDNFR